MAKESATILQQGPTRARPLVRIAVLSALVALAALSGCATMMAGGPDRLPVSTNPAGAAVFVDNAQVGQTPLMVSLDRAKPKAEIRLELQGFAPVIITREKSVNGWVFGNLLFGGLIGLIIDSANNNTSKFDDSPISIGFGSNPPPGPESDPRIFDCRKEREREIMEARQLPEKRERLEALRRVRTCS
jgi:PEGA domain